MNFDFLKKNKTAPSVKSLKPSAFDVEKMWYLSLAIGLLIIVMTSFVGFKFLYSQYFKEDQKSDSLNDLEREMNIEKIKKAINTRNSEDSLKDLPRDPSI